jgi:antitoxin PrlF
MSKTETYRATPARVGNSQGFRMDAALFQDHPELRDGTYEAAYLGTGTILVRPRAAAPRRVSSDVDPVMAAYLAWTERTMTAEPELLRPMTARELQIAERLVAGVEVDLENDRLPDDFDLP